MIKPLERLISIFSVKPAPIGQDEEVIHINQVISKAALAYEKIRNAMDYREDHLLRKNATYRILKRKLLIEKMLINQTEEKLAEQLVCEMIRAGYLKNNTVPKKTIGEVQKIIAKYSALAQKTQLSQTIYLWLIEIAACEIEELLVPLTNDKALVKFAFQVMNHRVISSRGEIDEKEKELQLFLAVDRAIRKPDTGMLCFELLNLYYPEWQNPDEYQMQKIADNIEKIYFEINEQLNHPWKKSLMKITRRWSVIFWTLKDIIEKDPSEAFSIFEDEKTLELAINKATEARYRDVKKRLRRGVVRSIFYVFLTKMLLALVLEMPLDMFYKGMIDYTALTINVTFPPVLMFLVAITIGVPNKKNTEKIISEIMAIVFQNKNPQTYTLKAPKKRHIAITGILHILYVAVFLGSVYLIFSGLSIFGFMWFSALIFIFFLSVVSFFGIRIRKPVKEITLVEKRDNIFTLLIDFLSLPFATVGRWSSEKFSKINIFAFFFDFIVEAPFKILIETLEDLFGFWREKKEEAYEEN